MGQSRLHPFSITEQEVRFAQVSLSPLSNFEEESSVLNSRESLLQDPLIIVDRIIMGVLVLRLAVVITTHVLLFCHLVLCNDDNGHLMNETSVNDGFPHGGSDVLRTHSGKFKSDLAFVLFNIDELEDDVMVWMQTDLCIGCKLLPVALLGKQTPDTDRIARVDTRWGTRIRISTPLETYPTDNITYCELHYHFGLFGDYNLTVPGPRRNTSTVPECSLEIVKDPIYSYTAILVSYAALPVVILFAILWFYCIKDRFYKKDTGHTGTTTPNGVRSDDQVPLTVQTENHNKRAASTRLRSIDTFRGLAISNLVLGTSGDGQYWFMSHARWYGITVADFMFPWFVFIMGTSIHLCFDNLLSKSTPLKDIFKKLVVRSAILFLMGVCLQNDNDIRTLRIPGVLQRFGITYFIVASSYLLSRRLLMNRKSERTSKCYMAFRDTVDYLELPLAACCLTTHVCLTFLLPVPGCPRGYQGPGGPLVGVNGELTNCTGGAAGYIDRAFFTEAHLIKSSTADKVYHTNLHHDPEGILGTFNSIVLCVLGLQAGKILHLFKTARGRVIRLISWGLVLIACTATLTKCHMADGWIPLNKNLWSVSFVTVTGGTAFLIVTIFHLLIDVTHFWNGAPLFYAGMNSILLYLGAFILSGYLPFSWEPFVANHTEYVVLATWSMLLWIFIAYVLYRKKIFLRL